jgi:diketogulonate reductase-like aldo/keto reductase
MLVTRDLIYGTAWKQERTAELVIKAVALGFRSIDTANQKKHYREDFVGDALLEIYKTGIKREDLFLQTKFTSINGQDDRLPYDPADDLTTQVKSSFASSLKHLHTDYIDSFLMHGPSARDGMQEEDWEVYAAMEELQRTGQTKKIGVSNVDIEHVAELMERAKVKPSFVQNRCYATDGWDREVREFCKANGIIYQGFSLLTANPQVMRHPRIHELATRLGVTPQQIIFRFSQKVGMLPITGTTDEIHMKQDLAVSSFELSVDEVKMIEGLVG